MIRLRLATLVALALIAGSAEAAPWTYRGTLSDGGKPANGRYDIRLTLLDQGGRREALAPITFAGVAVQDGAFAVDVDFGVDLSNAPTMKLLTEVAENGSGFVALGEPSAFDPKATLAGVCWDTQGNAGTVGATDFLGTSDNQPLSFRVNNARKLLLDNLTNQIAGNALNVYDPGASGQTIGGGGAPGQNCGPTSQSDCFNETRFQFATIGGGLANTADEYATVGGGSGNFATGDYATVAGGKTSTAGGEYAAVAGGFRNLASGQYAVIGGGDTNVASGTSSAVAGGGDNVVIGNYGTVPGGQENCAGGVRAFAGGYRGRVRSPNAGSFGACITGSGDADGDEGAFLWSDSSSADPFTSSGPNQFAVRATGGLRWNGTGVNSTTSPAFAHQVNTATNACDGGSGANTRTYLNHPLLNDNPNAILVITPNYGTRSTGTSPPLDKTFGLYYGDTTVGGCPAGRWVIYQLSGSASAINNGARFNVWFVLP